ncbi:hypothetical protein LY78DRAFT_591968 [Colletotrichum sublineola]|nr:hypothetical protein LY78DRAFT_591968 [Colletotrichum sublineola]
MVADLTLNKQPALKDRQYGADFAAYVSACGGNLRHLSKREKSLVLSQGSEGDEMRYSAAANNASIGRSFCITEAGWIGLCLLTAREGDLVCLLFGGKVLYAIRRLRKYSAFVGECYVHGRMDGEALQDQVRAHAPVECFDLQ